jgi:hypothetical protein
MARVWIEAVDEDATEIDVFPFGSLAMQAVPKPSLVRRIAAPAIGALIALVGIVAIQLASSSESMTAHARFEPPVVAARVEAVAPAVVTAIVTPAVESVTRPVGVAKVAQVASVAKQRTVKKPRAGRRPVRVDASTALGVLRVR